MDYYYVINQEPIWVKDNIVNEMIPEKEFLRRKIWREKNSKNNDEIIDNEEYINREIVKVMFDVKRQYKSIEEIKKHLEYENISIDVNFNELKSFFEATINGFVSLFIFSYKNRKDFIGLYNYCKELIENINVFNDNTLSSKITSKLSKLINNIICCLLNNKDKNKYICYIYNKLIYSLQKYKWNNNSRSFDSKINLKILKDEINNYHIKRYTNFF